MIVGEQYIAIWWIVQSLVPRLWCKLPSSLELEDARSADECKAGWPESTREHRLALGIEA